MRTTVTTGGGEVAGPELRRTQWRSRWTAGATYGQGHGVKDGRTRTVTSSFTPPRSETNGDARGAVNKGTVGVGMPIIMQFERPVKDKAAVERALEVRADKTVEGAWLVRRPGVVFRTKYWPAHTNVTFDASQRPLPTACRRKNYRSLQGRRL